MYELTLVTDARDRTTRGELKLQLSDHIPRTTSAHEVGIGRPIVIGWADISVTSIKADIDGDPNSRDPDLPGVIHIFDGLLRLGNGMTFDAGTTTLIVLEAGPKGFRGHWTSSGAMAQRVDDRGQLADDRGWFCAIKSDSA
jgi:hypothetical protein